jgi:4-carboxymuconolactone decarboxylase
MAEPTSLPQGYAQAAAERLPMPPAGSLDEAQRVAAQALIDGPRKGVYGPFLPLLRSPELAGSRRQPGRAPAVSGCAGRPHS